jgi:hypothetical protein
VVQSDVSFTSFLTDLAEKMGTSITHLSQIGYILPWMVPRTGKPVPKLLENEDGFQTLISNVSEYIDEQKSKNRGKGKVRPFSITIVDTSSPTEVGKVSSFHKCDVVSVNIDLYQGNGKKRAPSQPPPPPSNTPSVWQDQEHELITLIEKKHECEEHKRACYVQPNGGHYQYTMEDLSIWASLLASGFSQLWFFFTDFEAEPTACNH